MEKAKEVALILLATKIISLRPENPYRWQSGMLTPIYCDHRELLYFPEERNRVIDIFADTVREAWPRVEVIAGVAIAGIPWGVLVAVRLNLPFIYVRKERKDHGKEKRIEGRLPATERKVCIIEDLISTGESLISAALAIREEAEVLVMGGSIFTYELPEAQKRFFDEGIEVFSLTNITALLEVTVETGYLTEDKAKIVRQWKDDPWSWGKKMGFEH